MILDRADEACTVYLPSCMYYRKGAILREFDTLVIAIGRAVAGRFKPYVPEEVRALLGSSEVMAYQRTLRTGEVTDIRAPPMAAGDARMDGLVFMVRPLASLWEIDPVGRIVWLDPCVMDEPADVRDAVVREALAAYAAWSASLGTVYAPTFMAKCSEADRALAGALRERTGMTEFGALIDTPVPGDTSFGLLNAYRKPYGLAMMSNKGGVRDWIWLGRP